MSKHLRKAGPRLLFAVVSFAVLTAWTSNKLAATIAEPSDDPAWPIAAVTDPTAFGFTVEGLDALDARMKEAVNKGEIAGINYALVKDGEVIRFEFMGNQSLGGAPMTEDTVVRIRSTGKTITAVAMMQLWEQGKWGSRKTRSPHSSRNQPSSRSRLGR